MRRIPPNAPMWTAVGLVLVGLLVIFLAWNSAAGVNPPVPAAQLPYLISGGCGGLAIVAAGLVMLRTVEARKDARRLERLLDEVLLELRERAAMQMPAARAPALAAVPDPPAATPETVLAGAGSYHREDCRLVTGRSDLQPMPGHLAEQRGLAPCRICHPGVRALAGSS